MSDQELDVLLESLRTGGPDLTQPPPQARAAFEAMMADMPVAPDIGFHDDSLAGIPALASSTPQAQDGRTLFYLHGGAYVIGSARAYRGLAAELARAAGAHGLALDYRLAPEHPFPAAVDDAVAAYRALLDRGAKPGSIVFAGDSAGGGLTVAALVAARDAGLPMPAAALLLSPWADLECAGGSMSSKAAEDPTLTRDGLVYMAGLYLGGAAARTPGASPIHADLSGLPPLLIQVGSAEVLLDDAVRLAAAAGAAGVATQLQVWPRMIHVWHAFAFMLSEGRDAVAEAGAFLERRLASPPVG